MPKPGQSADYYRNTAQEMRRIALRMRFAEYRHQLIRLADRFDLLAERMASDEGPPDPAACPERPAPARSAP